MDRFDGAIAGVGTRSGVRLVVGMWSASPFGTVTDVMVERSDGHRILIAPTRTVADYIAATYTFDEVRVETVALDRIAPSRLDVRAESLNLSITVGRRTGLGRVLGLVPRRMARTVAWCRVTDPAARLVRHGVRTVGSAGGGRREYYCALDEHQVIAASARLDNRDLGPLAPLAPPVRFGFSSAPARPSLVDVTTLIADGPQGPENV
ncbi:hypothetical protein [Streptomyces sp. VRA16 Mangrove soil]|uniref:hypothetical protein n=1 Tax=Streptomyces sp. VRA16 Mangrove soil TaxID=2817434 RepID=UPI001A9EEE36|nr:hypothetical protein [Streptomyces sp. VRA16 Mangrove soil]MBO1332728.1 hypothetical protein [Streptomyces sp. VRA16 Mangrove soil]